MNHSTKTAGFTIIEMVLAMAFLAFLLLAIALITLQITRQYNHGLIVKDINQISRSLGDDLTRDITASRPFDISTDSTQYYNSAVSGRLCLGDYSYIWNYGSSIAAGDNTLIKYDDGTVVRLARVSDKTKRYCLQTNGNFTVLTVNKSDAVELLSQSDHDLAVDYFQIYSADTASDSYTDERLYTVDVTISTNDNRSALTADDYQGYRCKISGDPGADPNYCVSQVFSLTARAQHRLE